MRNEEGRPLADSLIHVLCIADIVGTVGYDVTTSLLLDLKSEHRIDLTIANGENARQGKGLTPEIADSFFDIGIDVITSGNHIWNRDKIIPLLNEHPRILRPSNYPPGCPGKGSCIVEISNNHRVGVINLQGRSFLYNIDCPFRTADREIEALNDSGVHTIVVDFHAEATAEKIALAVYLDGRVSAVFGTHTHVQTADERILPGGTAFITDIGMTGPHDSIIGMDKTVALRRFLTQLPAYYKLASGDPKLCGIVLTLDGETGKAKTIQRFQISPTSDTLK